MNITRTSTALKRVIAPGTVNLIELLGSNLAIILL